MDSGYYVSDVMTLNPVVSKKGITILDAAKIMKKEDVDSLIIVDDSMHLIGIVTNEDIVRKAIVKLMPPDKTLIDEIMVKDVVTVEPTDTLERAVELMGQYHIRQLPVVSHGKVVGMLTAKDILKIQPSLIEIISHKIQVREEERKLNNLSFEQNF